MAKPTVPLLQKIATEIGLEIDIARQTWTEAAPIKGAQDQTLVLDLTNSTVRIQLNGYTLKEYDLDIVVRNK